MDLRIILASCLVALACSKSIGKTSILSHVTNDVKVYNMKAVFMHVTLKQMSV